MKRSTGIRLCKHSARNKVIVPHWVIAVINERLTAWDAINRIAEKETLQTRKENDKLMKDQNTMVSGTLLSSLFLRMLYNIPAPSETTCAGVHCPHRADTAAGEGAGGGSGSADQRHRVLHSVSGHQATTRLNIYADVVNRYM
jgi:hypothetical protein